MEYEFKYLTPEEVEFTRNAYEEDMKGKIDNRSEGKTIEEVCRNQIKGLSLNLDELKAKVELIETTIKLYNDNPRYNNPPFEYMNSDEYLEADKKVKMIELQQELSCNDESKNNFGKLLESSIIGIELWTQRLSEE